MLVRVIPKQPGAVVSRDGDLVIKHLARPQVNEDIVRSPPGRDFQPVVVQAGWSPERIVEPELDRVSRTYPERRWYVEAVVYPRQNVVGSDLQYRRRSPERGVDAS